RQLDQEHLVSYTQGGTLTLGSPSNEIDSGIAALGDDALAAIAAAYPRANDGVKYGIARILSARGDRGVRWLARLARDRRIRGRRWILSALSGTYTAVTVPLFS